MYKVRAFLRFEISGMFLTENIRHTEVEVGKREGKGQGRFDKKEEEFVRFVCGRSPVNENNTSGGFGEGSIRHTV